MRHAIFLGGQRQRGASLMVSLVFLVIIAMLGVTAANVTTLQERMAGHTRDRDLALQAAEAALRDAESRLADPAFRAGAAPYVATNGNDDAFWESCFAGGSPTCALIHTLSGINAMQTSGNGAVAAQPRYVLERKPDIGGTEIYRVTARAVGGTAEAIVILQAEFGYAP